MPPAMSERANLLFELLGDQPVPRQHVQRADFANLIIRGDMNHRQSLRRSSQALAVSQGMMLGLGKHAMPWHEPLPVCPERLDEERIDMKNVSTVATA